MSKDSNHLQFNVFPHSSKVMLAIIMLASVLLGFCQLFKFVIAALFLFIFLFLLDAF